MQAMAAQEIDFPVIGMRCASCVGRVERALSVVPGVLSATVNLGRESARVRADGSVTAEQLRRAVQAAGYDVAVHISVLSINGMTCTSCSGRVEKALRASPGVLSASVNLAMERAHVTELGESGDRTSLLAAVERAGYTASVPGLDLDAGVPAPVPSDAWQIAVSAALTLPLVMPMLAVLFGATLVVPAWVQWLLATPVQFWIGARFYRAVEIE